MQEAAADRRSLVGLASFAGLILALLLSIPLTLDRAQRNEPLTAAVSALMK